VVFMFQMTIKKSRKLENENENEKVKEVPKPKPKKRKKSHTEKNTFSLIYDSCIVKKLIPVFVYVIPEGKFEFSFSCSFQKLIVGTLRLPSPSLWDQNVFLEIQKWSTNNTLL